jgi:ABC-type xylose transport system permease subunit
LENLKNSKSEGKHLSMKKIDIRTFTMVAVLILLWVVFTTMTSKGFTALDRSFISFRNISNLLRQMTIVGIIGCSMVLLIVTGGIDLSAGVVAGFVGCVAAYLQVFQNMGTAPTIIICLVVGVVPYRGIAFRCGSGKRNFQTWPENQAWYPDRETVGHDYALACHYGGHNDHDFCYG